MGMKPRAARTFADATLQAKAVEAVEAATCYLQEETKVDGDYKFTDAQALAVIKRTASKMVRDAQ